MTERIMKFFLNKLTYQKTLDFYTRMRANPATSTF